MIVCGLALLAGLQVIGAQGPHGPPPPPECRGPPPGVNKPFECCQFPPFFEPKDFEECGFQKPEDRQQQGPPPPPDGSASDEDTSEEKKQREILRKHLPQDIRDMMKRFGFWRHHGGRGRGKHCTKQICLYKKYGMATDDGIDYEAAEAFLDKYAASNTEFKESVEAAKEKCVTGTDLPGPPHVCPANRLMFCVSSTVFYNCPTWQETEECTILKDHMEKCKQYLP